MSVKVIQLHIEENKLIAKAAKQDRSAQKALYEKYAPKMLSVSRMYIKDLHFAEDVLLKAFFKVFKNLNGFRNEGSFEGWIRRILVREAIDFLRAQKRRGFMEEFTESNVPLAEDLLSINDEIEALQHYIDELPTGYRSVLVLYGIEGYKHAEIAQMLNISEGASRSQLSKARQLVKEKWEKTKRKEQWS